jgi:GDP-L-fucose synthase
MNKSDTILVTGSKGLVGTAMRNLFAERGYTAVVGTSSQVCDLRSYSETYGLFKAVQPKYLFHSAARVFGIMGNMNNQGRSYLENTLINTNVIEAAHCVGVEKITVMGTNAVYPFPPKLPFNERDIFDGRPHSSESGYAHAKRGMLAMLEAYGESYGIDWAYIVSCNLYGPNDRFDPVNGHVVPSLIRKFYEAKRDGTPVTIWGDGSAERNFLYVKDLARLSIVVMESVQDAINVGDGKVYSIRQLVETLSKISGVTNIKWDTLKPNGQIFRAADLSRLNETGFKCQYSLERGLHETWEWYTGEQANIGHKQLMQGRPA